MPRLYLDPGHGGDDPGALGNGFKEKDLVLSIGLRIRKLLKSYQGTQVRMSRTTDKFVKLSDRSKDANDWEADFFLSIHLNAFNGVARGYEDFVFNGLSNSSDTRQHQRVIHEEVYKSINELGSTPNRGRKSANFAVLRQTNMPAVLTENLFIDSPSDGKMIKRKDYVDKVAEGHVNGLVRIFDLKKSSSDSSDKDNSGTSSQNEFLSQIKTGAINGWKKHKVLPSITGAQAALESGWGTSTLSTESNNLFGIKASADWKGEKKSYKTKEQDSKGNETTIDAYFRVYDSWSDSVEDHGEFFKSTDWRKKNYAKVVGEINYVTAANELKNAGYATDVKYPEKIIRIIEQYNLHEWDREAIGSSYQEPTNSRPSPSPSKRKKNSDGTYTVRVGDNLTAISRDFNVSIDNLVSWNNLKSKNLINVGQKLRLSKPSSSSSTHTVKAGDNLWDISQKYGTTVSDIKSENNLSSDTIHPGNKLTIPGKSSPSGGSTVHVVKSGDNLSTLASRYGTTVNAIVQANNISNPDVIRQGQKLTIPSGSSGSTKKYHTVNSGESVSVIASKYGTTTKRITDLNNLSNPDLIHAGQKLRVR